MKDSPDAKTFTTATWLVGVVTAHKTRQTADGRWVCWRGRTSLAAVMGLSPRSVTTARGQLDAAGIYSFTFAKQGDQVSGTNGKVYPLKRGTLISTLVMSPASYLAEREAYRQSHPQAPRRDKKMRRQVDAARKALAKLDVANAVQPLRVELGQMVCREQMTDAEFHDRIHEAELDARRVRREGKAFTQGLAAK